jgi:hypothetical protein
MVKRGAGTIRYDTIQRNIGFRVVKEREGRKEEKKDR